MAKTKHPWKRWFKKKRAFCLKRGKDFDGMAHTMAQQIRNKAYPRNIPVSIQIVDSETIRVKFGG